MSNQVKAIKSPRQTVGYAALERGGKLVPWTFERRALREHDVAMNVLYSGVCHSDLHAIHEWGKNYPLVPGHEIVGEVTEVGSAVTRFKAGDRVMIGTIIDSCRVCPHCRQQEETYCYEFPVTTYDGHDRVDGSLTRGGYSDYYVADEHFVYPLPEGLDPAGAAPLLCAGVTTFAPLRHWQAGEGSVVGIVGIGGLGHLAIKFARAMGAHVVAFTTSAQKREQALALGAHEVVLSTDEKQMAAQRLRFDFILDTVSRSYPLTPMIHALKLDATLCSLGIPPYFDLQPIALAMGRRRLASSGAAGTKDTRAMLAFCQQHNIVADVEVVAIRDINSVLARLEKGDVRYRFVIDMQRG
ncbi:NAD(P)-dependent alcohol dehydrogenase [Erwinia sp. 9145]|uniref:NAD(P)-dependent alcohol dehydrogenase n=1 Tax=Erwinia sp. 9145 TaxID=1500895 RepID=UPI0006896615|nr:NAD(P)-dependent alcohol dehydrogenase [Erwinia sp. 9145]